MLPRALAVHLGAARLALMRGDPGVAGAHIRLEVEAALTLVDRQRSILRTRRLIHQACRDYARPETADRARREIGRLLRRLEEQLAVAVPSKAAQRRAKAWTETPTTNPRQPHPQGAPDAMSDPDTLSRAELAIAQARRLRSEAEICRAVSQDAVTQTHRLARELRACVSTLSVTQDMSPAGGRGRADESR